MVGIWIISVTFLLQRGHLSDICYQYDVQSPQNTCPQIKRHFPPSKLSSKQTKHIDKRGFSIFYP